MDLVISSSAFKDGDSIPVKYTADGQNVSPTLEWTDAPSGTTSFALINDDPDAPVGTWVHWVVYDIDSNITALDENVSSTELEQMGAKEGKTDFGTVGYGGPAPPRGPVHRYFFKLYALDKKLGLAKGATKTDVVKAMDGHILAEGQLVGLYQR